MAPASRAVAQAKLVSVNVASKSVHNIQHMMTHTLGFPRMDFEDRAQRGLYFGHKEKPRHAHGKKHFLTRAEFVTDAFSTEGPQFEVILNLDPRLRPKCGHM